MLDHPVSSAWADGSFGLSARTTNREAAENLVKWLATPEFGQLFADELKQFSPVPGVKYNDPLMAEMWDQYSKNPAPYLMLVNFRYGTPSGTDLVGAGVQKLLLGDQTAEQVAGDVQKGVTTWFKPSA